MKCKIAFSKPRLHTQIVYNSKKYFFRCDHPELKCVRKSSKFFPDSSILNDQHTIILPVESFPVVRTLPAHVINNLSGYRLI